MVQADKVYDMSVLSWFEFEHAFNTFYSTDLKLSVCYSVIYLILKPFCDCGIAVKLWQ